jgi:hypothetical protein
MGILSMLVKLGIDSTQFEMGVKRAQSVGEKFGNSFKSAVTSKLAGALSVAAVTAFASSVAKAADDIRDLSKQLNVNTDNIQRLQILASETGVSFEQFASILEKTAKARIEATSGDEAQIKRMAALGVSLSDLNNIQIENFDLSQKLVAAYKESGKSAQTTTAITELYGLGLRKAAAALAEYQTTSNRNLFSSKNIDDLAKSNNLLDEQYRRLKAISSPAIAEGLKLTGEAFRSFVDGFDKRNFFSAPLYVSAVSGGANQKGGFMESARAFSQSPLAAKFANQQPEKTGGNPPAIGTPQFERVKGERFSLGGSQDPLARIGGFSGFQGAQDTAIRQAIEQTLQLKMIVKNTDKTSRNTED